MSKHYNPTVIGAFVIGAVVLVAGAFAMFGGAQIFAKKNRYVALFDESTSGLRVGANVLLNGVRIGYVSDIHLLIDESSFATATQVTLEIVPEDYVMTRRGQAIAANIAEVIDHDALIKKAGLRATLEVESFVTGQLRVALHFRPDTTPIMRAVDPPYPEIPTITSNIQELLDKVQTWFTDIQENVDFGDLSKKLADALAGIDELVRSEDLHASLSGLNQLLNDENTKDLSASFQAALQDLSAASASADKLFRNADEGVASFVGNMQPVMARLNAALGEAEETLAIAKNQLGGDSEELYQLQTTLDELERAARAVREFFDYLERNPEALVRGKSK